MNEEYQEALIEEPKIVEVHEIGIENMIIPECCREGWDSCPHVPKQFKPSKKNIGL